MVGNASVTHLERVDGRFQLVEFGNVEHLRVEGAPVTVHPGVDDVTPQ